MENEETDDQNGNDGRELNQKLDKLMGMFNQMYGAIEDMHAKQEIMDTKINLIE